jgi:hypothetical protein
MWSEIFGFGRSEYISLKNTQLILELSFAIPGISATAKEVFSITNALWTEEESSFLIETIKAMVVTQTHFRNFRATTSIL